MSTPYVSSTDYQTKGCMTKRMVPAKSWLSGRLIKNVLKPQKDKQDVDCKPWTTKMVVVQTHVLRNKH